MKVTPLLVLVGLLGCGGGDDDGGGGAVDASVDADASPGGSSTDAAAERSLDAAPGTPVDCSGTCDCPAGEVCDFDCGPSGCDKGECIEATCHAECVGGGCELDCDMGACDYDCPGGDCVYDCDNESSCGYTCAGGGCSVECDGGSTCAI